MSRSAVDFPDPVLPTSAKVLPPSILKETSFKTRLSGVYPKETLSNDKEKS